MTRQTIQQTGAWRLDVEVTRSQWGATVRFISFIPSARHPEDQVKFQLNLSPDELAALQKVLSEAVAAATL